MDEENESFEEFLKKNTSQPTQSSAVAEVKKSEDGETFEDFLKKNTDQSLAAPTGGQGLSGSQYRPVESATIGSGPLGSGRFIKPTPAPEAQETEIDKIAKIPYADQDTRGFSKEILKSYSDPKTLKEIEEKVPWYRPTDDQLRVLQTHDREKTAKQALSEIGTAAWDAFTQGPALLESMVKGGVGIGKDLTFGALAATHAPIVNAFGDQAAKDRVNQMMDKGIVSSRVLADAALGTGEAIIEPLQRMAKGGSSWTDSLLNADKSEEELFQNYKNRYISRVADYEAKEINPAVLARFTNWFSNLNFSGWDDGFADPIKPEEVTAMSGPLARDLGAGVISLFSPSVEARLARHNGDRKAAAIEKQTEDLAASNEMFDSAIARANQLKEDPEQVGFVGLVTPFNEFAAAGMLSKGLGAAAKAGFRGAREFGKTAEEINLLRSAQAAAAIKKTTDAAQSLEKAGMLERALEGGAKGLEYIEGKGTQIFERVPEGLRPFVKQGAVLTGLTGLGAALSDDEALGVKTGALLYGASKLPGVASNLMKARRIGAGAGKGMFETAAMMPNEMRATTTALAKIAGKKGDWIVDTAKDALKSNIHMAPLALALGIYNDEDAAGIARTFVEGGYLAGSHQLIGKVMGRDPIAVERKRKARNMAAEKALLGASPDHRKNVDDLTWDRVVEQRQAVAFRAAKAHAEAAAENPDSDNAKKLFEEKETAERLYREAMGASVETRQRFAEEMRGYFGDAEAYVNGSLSPGSNTKIELLTTEQIKDRFRNSGGIAPTESDLLPFEKSLGQSIAGGRPVDRPWFGNLKDQIIINFDKLVSDSQFTGEALPTILSHEIGHDLWKRKEYRTLMMPAYTELFGDEKRDENGNVVAGKAGIYDDEILFGMYGQKYLADHTPETVKQFAIASGLWDFENNTINRKAAVQYMREEVLADAMAGNLFGPPDSPIRAGLKWVESKITSASLKRVLSALNAAGVDPSVGEASGAVFTPEVRNMVREANRLIKQHEGIFEEVDPENIDPQSVITKKDILASKDLLQKYHSDSGKFVTRPSLVVIDADGTVIGQRPITTPNVFEGQWDYTADESGAVTPVRKRGYGPLPPEAEGMNIPDGATVRVQREIAYDNNGKPIEKSNRETRDDVLQRNEAIRAAIVGAADGTPGEVKPFTASGMSLRGKLTQKQRSAIMALPESIVPLSIKEKLFKVMDTIAKDDGSRLNTIYAARLNERGGYSPFAPEMRDFTPVSVTFSKDGNFLANTFSVSGLTRKLNLWKQHMPGKFAPWNGDMDAFKSDFQKYLKNWEPIWEDADGNRRARPGQSDLDADPQVAMAKKNVFNDLIGVSSEEFNPEVSELPTRRFTRAQKKRAKQSDPNTIFRSYRLDAMTDLVDSPVPEKYRIDYGLAKINFMPEGAEGVEPVMEEREQPRATTVLSSNPLATNATYVPPAAGRTQFKPAQEDPTMVGEGFYSQAGRVLLDKMPNKASAEQLKNILDPQKGSGVKGEELKWSGLVPYIESVQKEKGAVTKADVEQFLRDSYAAKFETRTMRQSKSLEGEFYSEDPSWGDTAKFDTIEEAEKSAMEMFGLTKSEAEDFVSETNQIDSEYGEDETQYSQYTLPNGKNYEETVLRMPNVEFTSTHFPDVSNYVAHMRTAEHGNGLVVEEFQTDLHQKARKEGYNEALPLEEVVSKFKKDIFELSDQQSRLLKAYESESKQLRELEARSEPLDAIDEEFALILRQSQSYLLNEITDRKYAIEDAEKELERYSSGKKVAYRKGGVADAPFRKDWPLQLFKYALQKAVATGKEWIGWTTGETQAERYDLTTKINQISVHKRTDAVTNKESKSVFVEVPVGEGSFTLGVDNNGVIDNTDAYTGGMLGKNIADVFGKEMAQKIMDAKSGDILKGNDLKIGGKGMYGFYDDILPKELGRYVKQWGGKVEKGSIETGEKTVIRTVWDQPDYEYTNNGWVSTETGQELPRNSAESLALSAYAGIFDERQITGAARQILHSGDILGGKITPIWRINITPEMRSGVQAGQARFMPESSKSQQPQTQPTDDTRRRTEPAGNGGRWYTERGYSPLAGAPNVFGRSGPIEKISALADKYAEDIGIPIRKQSAYATIDVERAKRLAKAYEEMPHDPENPAVKEAYADLIRQTLAQYNALVDGGYKFWFLDPANDPYEGKAWRAMRDLRETESMAVFPTEAGFGSGDTDIDVSNSPLLVDSGIKWPYGSPNGPLKRVTVNDVFRAIHDAWGHGIEGAGFRAQGEENAWQAHSRLFYGPAVGAMTTETRGQNSWLNYGPHAEKNQTASVEDTIFGDQKTGLMPEWTWQEGVVPDEPLLPRFMPEREQREEWVRSIDAAKETADEELKRLRGDRLNLSESKFEHNPSDDPEMGDSWSFVPPKDKYFENPSMYDVYESGGKYYVGEGYDGGFKTLQDAQETAMQRAMDESWKGSQSTFGSDVDSQNVVGQIFDSFPKQIGDVTNNGWFSTKWGSWYLEGRIPTGKDDYETFKLSIRDHDSGTRFQKPDKSFFVSKEWTPDETAKALKKAADWIANEADFTAPETITDDNQTRFMPDRPTRGININDKEQDFTGQILRGEKTIETRDQNRSLAPYVGKRVGIISTGKGPAMLRGLADIGDPVEYKTPEEFRAAQGMHQVTPESLYDIKEGKSKFGYPLSNIEELPVPQPVPRSGRVASNIEGIQFMPEKKKPKPKKKKADSGEKKLSPAEKLQEKIRSAMVVDVGDSISLPILQEAANGKPRLDKNGDPKIIKEGYKLVDSPEILNFVGGEVEDATKPDWDSLAYDVPKKFRKVIEKAIDSGAVDAAVNRAVAKTAEYLKNPEIAAGMGWYSRMRENLLNALGPEKRELLSQLLGATSAKTPVNENFLQAMDALEGIMEGRYDANRKAYLEMLASEEKGELNYLINREGYVGKIQGNIKQLEKNSKKLTGKKQKEAKTEIAKLKALIAIPEEARTKQQRVKITVLGSGLMPLRSNGKKFNANSMAVMKVIAGIWLDNRNAPKTPNFAGNLSGRTVQATIDVWAARFLRQLLYENSGQAWRIQPKSESGVTNQDFALGQVIMERMAKKLEMNPDDLQAILWFAEKDNWEKQQWTKNEGAEKSSFDEIFHKFFPKGKKPLTFKEAIELFAREKMELEEADAIYEEDDEDF